MNKSMIEYKDGFIYKIKQFFRNLFNKKNVNQDNQDYIVDKIIHHNIKNDNFKENIEIKQDKEEIKIIKLQK